MAPPLPDKIEPKPSTLQGRLAIVTGATRGIGQAITLDLLSRGCSVLGTYLKSTALASDLTALSASAPSPSIGTFHGVQADISTPVTSVATIIATLASTFPDRVVDIVINNAAQSTLCPLSALTSDDLNTSLTSNVVFPTMLVRALLPHLSHSGTGRIINISSESSRLARRNTSAYSCSKAALESLTRTWAVELGQTFNGLTVNTVAPGIVDTDLWEALPEGRKEFWVNQAKVTAVAPRIGNTSDVVGAVAWLVGDESRWISGTVVPVNGGAYCFS